MVNIKLFYYIFDFFLNFYFNTIIYYVFSMSYDFMNVIDNNSFLYQSPPSEKSNEWQISETLDFDVKLEQHEVENFLTNFNIDAATAKQYSAQFIGMTGHELIALLNRDDNDVLSKAEILSVIDDTSDKALNGTELDIIFTGEGENRELDAHAFRGFVHMLGGFEEGEIDQLLDYFLTSGKTADEIIIELTGDDNILDADDIEDLDNIFI